MPARTMRLGLTLPSDDHFGGSTWMFPTISISPDGAHVAYVATHNGIAQLYLRDTAESDGRPLPGTGGAHTPFFSPDGKWLGAVVGTKVVKFPVSGAEAVTLSSIPFEIYGAYWANNGWIYFGSEAPLGLVKIPVAGGATLGASYVDDANHETDHRFPEVLPGAQWILFAARKSTQTFDEADIIAESLKDGKRQTILKGGTNPHYIPTGYLAFVRAGMLMVVPFDPVKLQVKGEPTAVERIMENPLTGASQYDVSAAATLVYLRGDVTFGERELVFVDRGGVARLLTAKKRPYEEVALSPDGRLLAATIGGPTTDIWIHDIASGAETPFTSGGGHRSPAWAADGKRITYSAYTGGEEAWVIDRKPVTGNGAEEKVMSSETPIWPWFSSKDGHALVMEGPGRTGHHGASTQLDSQEIPVNLTPRDFDEDWAQVSPDGGWLAYNSDESGRQEVYVATFPGLNSKVQVSTEGGRHPQWSANGKELYYLMSSPADAPRPLAQRARLMALPIETSPALKAGTPHMLFDGPYFEGGHDYAVTPDGKGFIFIRESQPASGPGEMKVVLNWENGPTGRAPVK
jgi:serine/threonine-protein kinase